MNWQPGRLAATFVLLSTYSIGRCQTLTVTPAALTYAYTIGATQLPAAQTVQIKSSGTAALDFKLTVQPPGSAPWLIMTPTSGKTGTSASIRVNPSTLIAGTYTGVIQVDAVGASSPATIAVSLVIKNPPPTM